MLQFEHECCQFHDLNYLAPKIMTNWTSFIDKTIVITHSTPSFCIIYTQASMYEEESNLEWPDDVEGLGSKLPLEESATTSEK